MADIFISYAREDAAKVERLAPLLTAAGYSAWWDRNLTSGSRYLKETEAELKAAKAVLVIWSKASVESHWVADEAAVGRDENRLAAISFDGSMPPLGFRQFQVTDFSHWKGGVEEPPFASLVGALARLIGSSVAATPMAIKPASKPLFKRPAVVGGLVAAALAVIAAVAMFAMGPPGPPSAALTSQRIAFFGFTVDADDPVATSIAKSATDEVFEVMRANRLETSARTETLDTPKANRFARAEELGALYALSGEVRSDNGQVTIAIRFEDVTYRMTLSEKSIPSAPAEVAFLPTRAAIQSADTVRCIVNFRRELTRDTNELLKLIADACRDPRGSNREESVLAYGALVRAAPDVAYFKALLAFTMARTVASLPESGRQARINEAEEALKQATALDPKSARLALSRVLLAAVRGASMAELETAILAELGAPGLRDAGVYYARLNADLGQLLLTVGRVREAEPFFQLAMTNDPLLQNPPAFLAEAAAIRGQTSVAQARFEELFSRRPREWPWELWVSSAIFLGVGDGKAMLTSPPSIIPRRVVDCWLGIRKIRLLKQSKARTAGATKVAECLAGGVITEAAALAAFAALGDLDAAFVLAGKQVRTISDDSRHPVESLFWPTSRAMRADPRFLPLVEKLGLMEYWRATKSQPDVCETEDVPFCRELKAAKP